MSATGAALTYERQLNEWTSSHLRSVPTESGATPLSPETLLAAVGRTRPDLRITGLTITSRPERAVTVLAEPTPLYVDAYSGQELGARRGAGVRAFLTSARAWHRWLATEGERRPLARAVTGWSNLLFLFIVISGMYLWIPRVLTWSQVRPVLFFRRRLGTAKARDFNWHNVIGIWSSVPLFLVVLGGVPISFPWASDLVYRLAGEEPPVRGRPEGARPEANRSGSPRAAERGEPRAPLTLDGLDLAFARAAADQPEWQTISVRFPRRSDDPLPFSIDRGDGGQPQLRSTLSVTRAGDVTARETFADQTRGRQIRSVLRFTHTGEVLGLPGQTVAGLASAGAVVMVWTGLALSFRRLRAWQARRRSVLSASVPAGAVPEKL